MIRLLVLQIVDVETDGVFVVEGGGGGCGVRRCCRRAADLGTALARLAHRLALVTVSVVQKSGTHFEEAEQDSALTGAVQTWFRCDNLIGVIVLRALVRTTWCRAAPVRYE